MRLEKHHRWFVGGLAIPFAVALITALLTAAETQCPAPLPMRGGAVVARGLHAPEVGSSILSPRYEVRIRSEQL